MPRKRTPLAVAKVTGQTLQHPERFADRTEPPSQALGAPPDKLSVAERAVWLEMAEDMPWLAQSDRGVLGLAARLSVRVHEPDCPIGVFAQLRLCLSSMGGTPTDRTRIKFDDDAPSDPADEFLN